MRIGIDLGGTKTEGVVLSNNNRIIKTVRKLTPQNQGYKAILNNILLIINKLEQTVDQQCTVGIGTPGSITKKTGLLKYSNTICLNDQPLLVDLQQLLEREIRIENDANCFALSESIDGAAQGYKTVFGVIMGTGVGGGIVIDNKILSGLNGMSGEWGHNVLDPSGHACYCGQNGCVETYLSGPGLARHFNDFSDIEINEVEEIIELAKSGDQISIKTLDQFYKHFAKAISYVVKIVDPDIIVLGGGLSNISELYTIAATRVSNYFSHDISINIVENAHGDSSGVRGAAYLWN